MQNPYEAPNADLSIAGEQSERLDIFERFSTWYVFGLSIITLNLYVLYWLYTRSKTLNRLKDVDAIGDNFMSVTIVINIIALPLGFSHSMFEGRGNYALIPDIVSIAANILLLVWAFKIRHRLNDFLEAYQTLHAKAGPVFTFLFQILHLSYKINENLDLLQQASRAQGADGESASIEDQEAESTTEELPTAADSELAPSSSKA